MSTSSRILRFPGVWTPDRPLLPVLRLPVPVGPASTGEKLLTLDALAERRFRLLLFDPIPQGAPDTPWEQADQWLKATLPSWGAALVIAAGAETYEQTTGQTLPIQLE